MQPQKVLVPGLVALSLIACLEREEGTVVGRSVPPTSDVPFVQIKAAWKRISEYDDALLPSPERVYLFGKTVVVSDHSRSMVLAFDVVSGELRWSSPSVGEDPSSIVFVGDSSGQLFAIDRTSKSFLAFGDQGRLIARTPFPQGVSPSSGCYTNSALFFPRPSRIYNLARTEIRGSRWQPSKDLSRPISSKQSGHPLETHFELIPTNRGCAAIGTRYGDLVLVDSTGRETSRIQLAPTDRNKSGFNTENLQMRDRQMVYAASLARSVVIGMVDDSEDQDKTSIAVFAQGSGKRICVIDVGVKPRFISGTEANLALAVETREGRLGIMVVDVQNIVDECATEKASTN